MTPKDKAKELIDRFKPHADWNNDYGSAEKQANLKHAKNCAGIAVEEILDLDSGDSVDKDYWLEVKQELDKL